MADCLLVEALAEARVIVEDLREDDPLGAHELRIRAALLERSAAIMKLRPASRDDVVRIVKLALELRDDAATLRQLRRHPRRIVETMMD